MNRIAMVAFPMATCLLSSCAWHFSPQKSDLQMAAQAARTVGEEAALKQRAPQDLVPAKAVSAATVSKSKPTVIIAPAFTLPAVTPMAAPVTIDTAAKPTEGDQTSLPAMLASVTPMASEPTDKPKIMGPEVDVAIEVPTNGTAIHLASYREIGSAKRGWRKLTHSYQALQPLKPLYVSVEIPGKGHMLRLYGTGTTTASLKTICHERHMASLLRRQYRVLSVPQLSQHAKALSHCCRLSAI